MSFKLNNKAKDPLAVAIQNIQTGLTHNAGSLVQGDTTVGLCSLESLTETARGNVESAFESMTSLVQDGLTSAGIEGIQVDSPQMQAAAIAAMAYGDPSAYARHAMTHQAQATAGVSLMNGYEESAGVHSSMEAFDERALRESLPTSILFNYQAARQSPFNEMFYPTIVVTPDIAAVDVTINRLLVFREARHVSSGKATNFNKISLIDAEVDYTVLADRSTRLVPALDATPSTGNADKFAPAAVVGQTSIKVGNVAVPTAALAMGVELDLLGLSSYQPLVGSGILDNLDAIDARISLDALYLEHDDKELGIKFTTTGMPRSTFIKSIEGNYKEMNLHFPTKELVLTGDTKDLAAATIPALAPLAANGWTVFLAVNVNGSVNVENGTTKVWSSPISVSEIRTAGGAVVDLALPAAAAIKNTIEGWKLVGYDLGANRTNSNLRTRGLQLDVTFETERYTVPLGAPLTVPTPHTQSKEAVDLKTLIAAARSRTNGLATTKLFDYADQLERWVKAPRDYNNVPEIEGVGRYYIRPYFKRLKLNLVEALSSIRSQDRAADVAAALVSAVREQATAMYQETRIQAALDMLTGATGEKPMLLVGTCQKLHRYMIVPGDDRTFGIVFDKFQLESSMDLRVRNKIILAFGREKRDGVEALHFGNHAWVPELTCAVPVAFNGSNIKQTLVQPRQYHFNNLPAMVIIEVEGLAEALVDKTLDPADAVKTGPSQYMSGLGNP